MGQNGAGTWRAGRAPALGLYAAGEKAGHVDPDTWDENPSPYMLCYDPGTSHIGILTSVLNNISPTYSAR